MLTLTPTATTVIESLVAREADPGSAGLRIDGAAQQDEFAVTVERAPLPGDHVVESGSARVFLEQHASVALDDKVLDAHVGDEGSVRFAIGEQQGL